MPSHLSAEEANSTDGHTFRPAASSVPIDRTALQRYCAGIGLQIDQDHPIKQFATGLANINYRLSINGQMVVLRRPPSGDLPPGSHDMAREHRILARLHEVHPFAPKSLHLCTDKTILGVPFQFLEYRPGIVIRGDDSAQLIGYPERCAQLSRDLVNTLASLHAVDVREIGLGDLGRPTGFLKRTIEGWQSRVRRLSPTHSVAKLASEIAGWLSSRRFIERQPTLLHSDFKLDNVILDPLSLSPRAVIDWDMGTRGDPLFDLATFLSYWTQSDDPPCLHRLAQMPTTVAGFPQRDTLVAMYARLTGCDVSDYPQLRVLALLKLGVVLLQLDALRQRRSQTASCSARFDEMAEEILALAAQAIPATK
ncbi:MAG: phosphotransferase family protein [Hyphomicrobiaceae bacterium]